MKPSEKTSTWDGKQKATIRALKVQEIKYASKEKRITKEPVALTLAGAKAHLEISIANQGLVKPENIITIQSPVLPNKEVGSKVLRGLVRLRDKSLPGMLIWPESFSSFCEGYGKDKVAVPTVVARKGKPPAWFKSQSFRKEMHNFLEASPRPLEVVDADLCGIFSEDNGSSIANLMRSGAFADSGVLFINHQKGRDGKCIPFLNKYFQEEGLFDLSSFKDYYGEALTLTLEGKGKWQKQAMFHAIRSSLVPMYYVLEAFKAGYRLDIVRLAEYRDRNSKSGVGVNMLQWFFRFEKLGSAKLSGRGGMRAYTKQLKGLREDEKDTLKYQLDIISKEAYVYSNYVD